MNAMKTRLLALAMLGLSLSGLAQGTAPYDTNRGFTHPGCLHTEADFDRIKAQLAANDATVKAGYDKMAASAYASANFTTYPTEVILRGGTGGENYMNAARGGAAAYLNAVMWKITGKKAHADKAIDILNRWAATCRGIGGDTNFALAAGLYGYAFANAAELMRDYSGWKVEEQEAVKQWFMDVWYPSAISFLRARNGTWDNGSKWWQAPGHYWSNWGLCNTLCVMSIGIYLDDPFIYNQGVSFYKYDQCGTFKDMTPEQVAQGDGYIWNWGLTEFIGNLVPIESQCTDETMTAFGRISQMQESGRDQGHAAMAGGLAIDLCQTGLNQGDDLYALMNDRLAGGLEHLAAFNNGGVTDLPFVTYKLQTSGFTLADGRGGTHTADAPGSFTRPGWTRALAYYEGMRGVTMKYARMAQKALGIECGPGYYGETSGGFDHLGYGTALCTRPACAPEDAIYVLHTSVSYGGKTYQQNNLGALKNTFTPNIATGLAPGTEVTLTAALPEGAEDDGQWLWDDGTTLPYRIVKADSSRMYRVWYTSARGIVSTANFTIAVQGDSRPDKLYHTATVGGKTTGDTILFCQPGDDVTLSVESKVGWSTSTAYAWSNAEGVTSQGREQSVNGKKTQSVTLSKVKRPQTLTCTYTNQNKVVSKVTFHIYVQEDYAMPVGDYYIINRATGQYLTNNDSSYPLCEPQADSVCASQLWHIAPDGDRFMITSLKDNRFVGGAGNFPTTEYSTKSHSFMFQQLQGTDHYNITRLAGSTSYWCGWAANGRINGSLSKTPVEYPFTIVKADLNPVAACRCSNAVATARYTLSGVPASSSYKGIVISHGKKIVY